MTLVSTKETEKIFLTTKTQFKETNKKIDIIVSPEYYWVRKFEIPVKTETQARHVLPTLFEDIIDEVTSLTYQVIKLEENQFLCFAYNNKKIFEAIKKSNIPTSEISSIYFAQNECKNFKAFTIDDMVFMYTNENILVKVPGNIQVDEAIPLRKVLANIKPSSYKLQMKLYNDVLSSKFYYTLFIIFGILIITNFFKYFSYSNEISKLDKQIENIKNNSNIPRSMLQVDSILKKYDSTVLKENKKRDAISYVVNNTKFDLKSVSLEKEVLVLEYHSINRNELEKFLKRKFKSVDIEQNSFNTKVSIKL